MANTEDKMFVRVDVGHQHVGEVMFAMGKSHGKYCGKIEYFGGGTFVCAHNPDPKDQFKTTGTVIKYVFEEVVLPTDDQILEAVLVKQDKDQTQFMRGIDFIMNWIEINK